MARWTEEEIEYLTDNVGILDYKTLSQKLGKSTIAIKEYRCVHKLPRFYDTFYSYTLLARELGRSRSTIRKYYSRGWLVGRKATWTYRYNKHPMIFTDENITQFLKEHHDLLAIRQVV